MPVPRPAARGTRPARSQPGQSGRGRANGTLADSAYSRLREGIVTLRLAPGTPLTEVELCARLGISRTPIRTALLRLHQEGLLLAAGRKRSGRFVVSPLTTDDMRELFLMVGALDGVAARLAAQLEEPRRKKLVERATTINEHLHRFLASSEASDIRAAQELDLRFHHVYEDAAAGPRLLAKLRALHARRERYVRVYTEALVQTHRVQESLDEHGSILGAILRGDADLAERSAVFNYRNALERYGRIVAIHGERGNWS